MNNIRIVELPSALEAEYSKFVLERENISIYHSLIYRDLLSVCTGANAHYFIAIDNDNKIVGVLPSFVKDGKHGKILNSLPFYGSHGGVIGDDKDIAKELLQFLETFAEKERYLSFTINSNLYDSMIAMYVSILKPTAIIKKTGQITLLPSSDKNIEEILMSQFHQKTRNIIRKSLSCNFEVLIMNNDQSFKALANLHTQNMISKGLIPKPALFFNHIQKNWIPGKDYNIYIAKKDDEIISGLLVLFFNKTVEYYCPATNLEYRNKNPLSLIIYFAMLDSVKKGIKYWNWGGSSVNQKSVYDFKKKWGTIDVEYFTFNKILKNHLLELNQTAINDDFNYFFAYPFKNE